MTGDAIVIERLSKRYGAKVALHDLSLRVPRGAVVGLLGFNGAGKSTTMDILATLSRPSGGRALVAGHDVVEEPLAARRAMAIVFESAIAPRPAWTVAEYLAFFQALRNEPPPPDALYDLLDLGALRHQTTGTLSAGQRKRVEIARAMAARPQVLLLDEPTKEVDMKGKRVVWEAIRRQAREGTSVLLCSHDVLEVRDLCDRVLVLHEGRATATIERAQLAGADLLRLEELLVASMEGR